MGKASRRKKERRFKPTRFPAMNIPDANEKCGKIYNKNRVARTECPTCEFAVFLHCDNCKIQITGCFCTAKERMTDEDYKEFVRQVRAKKARESGLILPPSVN